VQLTISGSGGSSTLDGGGSFGLVVDAGSVTIENLDISNAVLSGGPIPDTVTLSNDVFSGTVAISNKLTIDEVAPVTLGDTHGPATVINQAGSTYDVDVVGDAIDEGPAGVSRFVNKGTLAQTGLVPGISEIHVDVTDTGTLSVDGSSNLRFFGANNSFSGTYVGGGMIDYWDGSTDALGTIDMTNGACTTVEGATVNQSGVVTLSASTTIKLLTGTWNFTSDNGLAAVDPSSSATSFTLDGALAKTGGTGTTVIGCDFNGNGAATINVALGTLAFDGLSNNFSDAITGAGTFSVGGGGADAINTGTTINTSGWTITHADTDVTLNVALSYSGIFREQSGATLTLTPSNNLTLTNSATFTDATIDGSGILTLAGGKVTMNGGTIGAGVTVELLSGTLSESGIVTNSGTLFASGGTVLIAGTANGITVGVGGKEIVQSGGTAIGTTILAGGTVTVSSGGTFEFTSGTTGMPIVRSGATLEVGSGYVFSGPINSGVRLEILSGGTDSGATVSSGGREIVLAGGTASNTTFLKGGVESVSAGGSASDTTVSSGGALYVVSGGIADPAAILSGGSEIVSAHGTDDGAHISGGKQLVFGVASGVTVFAGSQVVEAGGTASNTTVSGGGTEIVLSGGTAIGATSLAGGTVTVSSGGTFEFTSGTTAKPIVHAGATLEIGSGYVFSGTVNSGVRVEILSGGVDSGATVSSGGKEIVFAGGTASNTTVLKGGVEVVSAGGSASDTMVSNGGTLDVLSGGFADPTTIHSGGTEIVSAHGTDDSANISGGRQLVYGTASGATIFSGSQIVEAGGTASSTTVSSGGTEIVLSGGTAVGATSLAGGTVTVSSGGTFEFTSGTTAKPVVHAGATLETGSGYVFSGTVNSGIKLEILSGGADVGVTVSSGGKEIVFAGGTASNTTVLKGGVEIVSSGGSGSGTTVSSGGTVNVLSGDTLFENATVFGGGKVNVAGTTRNVTVASGGIETVSSGGIASGATISGGTLQITSDGSVGGTVTFAASTGKLLLDATTFSGTVAGMTAQDTIDLRDFAFGTVHVTSSVTTNTSATLTVTDGADIAHILLLGNYIGSTFTLSNDGHGGTSMVDPHVPASVASLTQTHKG
jgi:autotransporter passenger strand-loop-strand repeat protein